MVVESSWLKEILDDARREGRQQGREEVRQEGWREGWREAWQERTLQLLEKRFGRIPPLLAERVRAVHDEARLRQLFDLAADSADLASFESASDLMHQSYEVELKFPLADPERIRSELDALGARRHAAVEQIDRYFNHPSRDFAETDEALRIRQVGGASRVTYKGPKVDPRTKTRREIEIAVGEFPDDGEQFAEMLRLLGFREVRTVRKQRVPYELTWEGRSVEVSLDEVDELGAFAEIETAADENDRDAARDAILRLADRLKLANSERRSYLCLLLEADGRKEAQKAQEED